MPQITCKQCGQKLSLDDALLLDIRNETKTELLRDFERQKAEITQKVEQKIRNEFDEKQSIELIDLRKQVNDQDIKLKEFRDQELILRSEKRKLADQQKEFEITLRRRIDEERNTILQLAKKEAEESQRLRILEKDKQLQDALKVNADLKRKLEQGSQQIQGEVLELDLENKLRQAFPLDEISEVKKGQRGADIKQVVVSPHGVPCGLILWETKNGTWHPAWVQKFREDMRNTGAAVGVLVSEYVPESVGEFSEIDRGLWVAKPALATKLAMALRVLLLQVNNVQRSLVAKDERMEVLYTYLTGTEFRHRVEAIIEHYGRLQEEIEREKRAAQLRWTRQEKSIRSVIDNTIGMYGELQGITNSALPVIKTLELSEPEVRKNEVESEE